MPCFWSVSLTSIQPPFGTYALPVPLEWLREKASLYPENRLGRWAVSVTRKLCLAIRAGPVDVEVYPTVFARVYPTTNRCEKRVFAGPQFFDLPEREFLAEALNEDAGDAPFHFLDLGANVGMYSLWVVAEGRRLGRTVNVVAVEPDPVTGARLAANIAASSAQNHVSVVACGVGGQAGTARMVEDGRNRGGNQIDIVDPNAAAGEVFQVVTIPQICDANGFDRVDALKIDVEGHDHAALEGLFKSGRRELFPKWIQAEAGRGGGVSDLERLCRDNGYTLRARTKLNIIMQHTADPADGSGRT